MRFNISALAGLLQHVKKCHCGRVGYSRTQTNFAAGRNARSTTRFLYAVPAVLRRALPQGTKKTPAPQRAARVICHTVGGRFT